MPSLSAFFYDWCMRATEQACLIAWRKELLSQVDGQVLELGAGTGASLDFYPKKASLMLQLSEPDRNMRAQLEKKAAASGLANVTIIDSAAEGIASADAVYDYVFVSLVCCSVADVPAALNEIKRVLKPDGSLLFLEHVAAQQGTKRRQWQNRLNGFWRKLAGNCHLNRETEQSIKDAGFNIVEIKHDSMRSAMPLVRPTIRGVAKVHDAGRANVSSP